MASDFRVFFIAQKAFWGKLRPEHKFVTKEAIVPLSKRKLQIYAKYRKVELRPIREFDNGTGHPVVLMSECRIGEPRKKNSWLTFMCPCELTWKWEKFGTPPKRTMIMYGDSHNCVAQEDARKVVREEFRQKYRHLWAFMSFPDAIYFIWQKHLAGEYTGEFNIGTIYVQDMEALLGSEPEVMDIHLGPGINSEGKEVSPPRVEHVSFPSKTILSAVGELKKRKLIDLNGMILVPYKESFRFPEELHHQLAYWIEEPLGWPNGDAGDCFIFDLYRRIVGWRAQGTGYHWQCGEEVFGSANIPKLTPAWVAHIPKWMTNLDPRLTDDKVKNKGKVLQEIRLEEWISWLMAIRQEVLGTPEA